MMSFVSARANAARQRYKVTQAVSLRGCGDAILKSRSLRRQLAVVSGHGLRNSTHVYRTEESGSDLLLRLFQLERKSDSRDGRFSEQNVTQRRKGGKDAKKNSD